MKILVANRGEIACRILTTLRQMAIPSVAIYADVDADAPHVFLADEAVSLGAPGAYADGAAVLAAARHTGCEAIHPGYGFLSESARFAELCEKASVIFIGPSSASMQRLGDKLLARRLAESVGVQPVPGTVADIDAAAAAREAARIGYPVLLKAALGGGGKGIRRVETPDGLAEGWAEATREAQSTCHDGRLILEKCIVEARHIEVQMLADGKRAMVLGERECSLQRRHQKLIEEAPATRLTARVREQLYEAAINVTVAAGYAGAGTAEFLLDAEGRHYFLEFNPRLQVEHAVTEMLTGIDLVRAQVEIALGGGGGLPSALSIRGHAIEARLCAEDPYHGFAPQVGCIELLDLPHLPFVRIDSGIREGLTITPYYDSLLAKLIAWGADREQARQRLSAALRSTTLLGIGTNLSLLVQLVESDAFVRAHVLTTTVEATPWVAPTVPEYVRAAAAQLVASRPAATLASAGGSVGAATAAQAAADPYSPWQSLKGFRVGR